MDVAVCQASLRSKIGSSDPILVALTTSGQLAFSPAFLYFILLGAILQPARRPTRFPNNQTLYLQHPNYMMSAYPFTKQSNFVLTKSKLYDVCVPVSQTVKPCTYKIQTIRCLRTRFPNNQTLYLQHPNYRISAYPFPKQSNLVLTTSKL